MGFSASSKVTLGLGLRLFWLDFPLVFKIPKMGFYGLAPDLGPFFAKAFFPSLFIFIARVLAFLRTPTCFKILFFRVVSCFFCDLREVCERLDSFREFLLAFKFSTFLLSFSFSFSCAFFI